MSAKGFAAIGRPQECRRGDSLSIANSNGFTLIEVVLALSIFALMGAILYGAFSLSHTAVAKSDTNSTRNQKQRVIADLLGSYVRSSFPYRDSPQDQSVFFDDARQARHVMRVYDLIDIRWVLKQWLPLRQNCLGTTVVSPLRDRPVILRNMVKQRS